MKSPVRPTANTCAFFRNAGVGQPLHSNRTFTRDKEQDITYKLPEQKSSRSPGNSPPFPLKAYYRCAKYNKPGHSRNRATEADFDRVVLETFQRMKIEDEKLRDWIRKILQAKTRERQKVDREAQAEQRRQHALLTGQRDRLLNLRLLGEIETETFAKKDAELRDKIAEVQLQIEGSDRQRSENGETAVKVFELSQCLADKWVSADIPEKRQLLEILCLNFSYDGVSLCMTMRKPFQILSERALVYCGRGDQSKPLLKLPAFCI